MEKIPLRTKTDVDQQYCGVFSTFL